MIIFLYVLLSVALTSAISLFAVVVLTKSTLIRRYMPLVVSFAAGSLLGEAFLHAIPESLEQFAKSPAVVAQMVLGGMVLFFLVEKAVHWHHAHTHPCAGHDDHHTPVHAGRMLACGSVVHNMLDGAVIAAAFQVDTTVGFATVLAIIFHEIPQEMSTFAVTLGYYGRRAAVKLNVWSALGSLFGAGVILVWHNPAVAAIALPLGAGGFIYIAASDLIPEMHKERPNTAMRQAVALSAGIAMMWLISHH